MARRSPRLAFVLSAACAPVACAPIARAALACVLLACVLLACVLLACVQSTVDRRDGSVESAAVAAGTKAAPANGSSTTATAPPRADGGAAAPVAAPVAARGAPVVAAGHGEPPAELPTPPAIERALRDRVLIKLSDAQAFDEAGLVAELARRTGAKVQALRRGPLGLLQVTFAPSSPPRDEAAQRDLVEALSGMDGVKYVEPERLMRAKQTEPGE